MKGQSADFVYVRCVSILETRYESLLKLMLCIVYVRFFFFYETVTQDLKWKPFYERGL